METRTKIILFVIVLITGVVLWRFFLPAPVSPISPPSPLPASPAGGSSQENEGGNVTVSVTPVTLKPGFPPSFDVAFETHSVDLVFDVEKVATLTDAAGTVYTPYWDGSPPGGHHRSGTLRFTPDLPAGEAGLAGPSTLTLTFKDIAGIPERTFIWEVAVP